MQVMNGAEVPPGMPIVETRGRLEALSIGMPGYQPSAELFSQGSQGSGVPTTMKQEFVTREAIREAIAIARGAGAAPAQSQAAAQPPAPAQAPAELYRAQLQALQGMGFADEAQWLDMLSCALEALFLVHCFVVAHAVIVFEHWKQPTEMSILRSTSSSNFELTSAPCLCCFSSLSLSPLSLPFFPFSLSLSFFRFLSNIGMLDIGSKA